MTQPDDDFPADRRSQNRIRNEDTPQARAMWANIDRAAALLPPWAVRQVEAALGASPDSTTGSAVLPPAEAPDAVSAVPSGSAGEPAPPEAGTIKVPAADQNSSFEADSVRALAGGPPPQREGTRDADS